MEIQIADTEQYLALITAIEDYNLSQPKVVTYLGGGIHVEATQERLDLPYTTYSLENNTMWADEVVLALAVENDIVYTEV
jgi:hypothetical protein